MRAFRLLVAVGVAVALLAGCGEGGSTQTAEAPPERPRQPRDVWVVLNGYDNAENLGILMADERGFFADVGLTARISSPANPSRPVRYVLSEVSEIGVSHQPQVAISGAKGRSVVAVGSLISRPTGAMIWLKRAKIDGIADLKGKTIAIPGLPYQESFLQSVLARAGLTLRDVTVKHVGYELVPALLDGRADAIFGGSANVEGAALEARGAAPVVTPVGDLGIPSYDELVVIAPADRVSKDPQLIRDFMTAVARGTAAAVEDPKAAVKVIEGSVEANPDSSRKEIEAEVEATLPLLSESGEMDSDQAEELVDWMYEEGLIQRKPSVSDLLTNDYNCSAFNCSSSSIP
jgi:putative hydroxymethylpyrimidine transport system substrate-binding protein